MKQLGKSSGIPLDEIRLARLREPKRADFAMKLALKEFGKNGDVASILATLRLVARARGEIAA